MYKVTFNTRNFNNRRNRRDWEDLLRNDFAVAIDGKSFECETVEDLYDRLSIIAGNKTSTNNDDYFYLEDERYNKQLLPYAMYGIAQGYVNLDKAIERVNNSGSDSIPFGNFYDLRQGNFFKNCYVEIQKI